MINAKYTIEVIREDIDNSDWHCHYCPKALALKRKLKELGICFFGAKIKPSKTYKTIDATIYYPVVANEIITISSYCTKVKSDIQWSKDMDECYKVSLTASSQIGGIYRNINYIGRKKSSIQPTNYEIKLPHSLFEISDYSWIKEIKTEQELCNLGSQYRIEDLKIEKELLKLKTYCKIDWLMCGELARRDFSNFSMVKIINREGILENEKNGEILIPTSCFNLKGLKKLIYQLKGRFEDNPNLIIYIAIRQICMGEIEVGVAIMW